MELLSFHGLEATEEDRMKALLGAVTVIDLDEAVEQQAIVLRRRLRLKPPDAIVAATAKVHGLELLTLDEPLAEKISKT